MRTKSIINILAERLRRQNFLRYPLDFPAFAKKLFPGFKVKFLFKDLLCLARVGLRNPTLKLIRAENEPARSELKWLKTKFTSDYQSFCKAIIRRTFKQEPIQYILGSQPFLNLDIIVKPPVLIPRWETEEMTAWMIEKFNNQSLQTNSYIHVIEIGFGTGCISLGIAKNSKVKTVINSFDISDKCLKIATENHRKILNTDIPSCVNFSKGDIFDFKTLEFKGLDSNMCHQLIISNPPYISIKSNSVKREVRLWEDKTALFDYSKAESARFGISFHLKLIDLAVTLMHTNNRFQQGLPLLVFEIGTESQIDPILQYSSVLYKKVQSKLHKDTSGKIRWISFYDDRICQ